MIWGKSLTSVSYLLVSGDWGLEYSSGCGLSRTVNCTIQYFHGMRGWRSLFRPMSNRLRLKKMNIRPWKIVSTKSTSVWVKLSLRNWLSVNLLLWFWALLFVSSLSIFPLLFCPLPLFLHSSFLRCNPCSVWLLWSLGTLMSIPKVRKSTSISSSKDFPYTQ